MTISDPTPIPMPLIKITEALHALDRAASQARLDEDPMRYILESLSAFLTALAALHVNAQSVMDDQIKRMLPTFTDQHIDQVCIAIIDAFRPAVSTTLRTLRQRLLIQTATLLIVVFSGGMLTGWFAFSNYPSHLCYLTPTPTPTRN